MTGKTHVICSTAAVTAFALGRKEGFDLSVVHIFPLISVVPAAIGALLPDIDIPQSRLGSKFRFLSKHLKHRGITHALLIPTALYLGMFSVQAATVGMALAILVGLLIGMVYGWKRGGIVGIVLMLLAWMLPDVGSSILFGLASGWTLHIVQDMFNTKGLPLFWPFSQHRFLFPVVCIVKTRHWTEYVFMLLWLGGCVVWGFLSLDGLSLMGKLPFL